MQKRQDERVSARPIISNVFNELLDTLFYHLHPYLYLSASPTAIFGAGAAIAFQEQAT